MYASDSENGVNLRELVEYGVAVALRETSGHDNALERPVLLEPAYVDYVVDRLLLRALNERAGVDDDDVRLKILAHDLNSLIIQLAEHDLRIELILRAAERDEEDLYLILHYCKIFLKK